MLLALISLLAFATQLGVSWMLAGTPGAQMLLFGTLAPIGKLELALIFTADIPASTVLMFTAPRLLIDRETLPEVLVRGPRAVLHHPGPVSILLVTMFLSVALAP
ncbi:MAG: hypothetical protein RQ741_09340 [Wenzhouxiangellaceae bacterium]|nr:hypothetical protein [Wenzhouxiangellaceae bacterium]